MSRPIKFRAWDIKNNRFVNIVRLIFDQFGALDYAEVVFKGKIYKVYPSEIVLEQYIGLKDKNGKEICVGDIVEIDKYGKYQIIWHEWACKFDFSKIGKREREEPLLSQDWEQETEIISNIHENSELLKGEEE